MRGEEEGKENICALVNLPESSDEISHIREAREIHHYA